MTATHTHADLRQAVTAVRETVADVTTPTTQLTPMATGVLLNRVLALFSIASSTNPDCGCRVALTINLTGQAGMILLRPQEPFDRVAVTRAATILALSIGAAALHLEDYDDNGEGTP